MQRDYDLLRRIMLTIAGSFDPLKQFELQGYDRSNVNEHVDYIVKCNMIRASCERTSSGEIAASRILEVLPHGHDFIGLIRNDSAWNSVMDNFKSHDIVPTLDMLYNALEQESVRRSS